MSKRLKQTVGSVSVVIPHQGADERLESCLRALRCQNYPPNKIETIVVLNEPHARDLGFELASGETVLWEPHYFSYAARNEGIRHAKGDVIALTDSDTLPHEDWVRQGVKAINQGADLVAGRIDLSFSSARLSPAACYEKLFAFDQEKNVRLGRATTANLFVRKKLLLSRGLFTADAESGEDFRWTSATVASGSLLRYAPLAVVTHPARETLRELLSKTRRVALHFPAGETAGKTLRIALAHYWSLYVVPPSNSRRASCSPRERILAHTVGIMIQVAKVFFFVRGFLGKRQLDS